MSSLLKRGQILHGSNTQTAYEIETFLGAGTQGEVYQAKANGQLVALKCYFPQYIKTDPNCQQRLEKAISKGNPDSNFLWPIELVFTDKPPLFGYVMPLRADRYKSIVDLMKRRIDPGFRELITACLGLVESFLHLHAKGFCYRDINFNNIFLNPQTGEILICDNDNVDVNGVAGAINGTPRFMAPELVRGDAAPCTESDLFSVSVLLFYMLMLHHPLEGKKEADIRCFDQAAMNRLYGTEPVFIFDPSDNSNYPVKGLHDNALTYWPLYPQFIRDLFTRAFTTGINDAQHGRVRENEWRNALIRLRDSMVYCACGAENFYDSEQLKQGQQQVCWSCNQPLIYPPRLRIENTIVMLNYDTRLYPHHIDKTRRFDFSEAAAQVTRHPQDLNRWGLQNLSDQSWTITLTDNTVKAVEPQRTVNLNAGIRINFGTIQAEIRV
jgi:eukaryotic-like serine/threonine-protein kinase